MYKRSSRKALAFSIKKRLFNRYSVLVYAAVLLLIAAVGVASLVFNQAKPAHATHAAPLVRDQVSVTIDKGVSGKQVSRPTTQAGDLLVLILSADAGDHTGTVLPTGFTEIGRNSLGTGRLHYLVGTKVATSSEPSAYSLTVPTGSDAMASLISIQNADTSAQPIISKTNTSASTTSHIAPKVAPKGSSDLLLSTVALDSTNPAILGTNSWTPALGMTELVDQQYGSEMSMTVAHEALSNGGDAGVRTFMASASSANPGLSYSLAIKGMSDVSSQVVPNSLVSGATWTGTLDYTRIDEGQTLDGLYINTGTATGETSVTYDMTTVAGTYDATGITLNVCINATTAAGTIVDDIAPSITIGGATIAGAMFKPAVNSSQCSWQTIEFTGLWNKADIDGLRITFTRTVQGTDNRAARNVDDIRIDSAYTDITRTPTVASIPATSTNPAMRAISSANQSSAIANKSVATPSYQQGDLIIAILSADNGLMTDMNLPAGFTEIGWLDQGPNQLHVKVGTKTAGAAEPASYSYAASANANTRIDIISVQGADVSTIPKVTRYMTPASDTKHAAPGVFPHAGNDLLLSAIAINPIQNLGTTWSSNNAWMLEISDMQTDNKLSMMAARQSLTTSNPSGLKGFLTTTTSVTSGAAISLSIKGASIPSLTEQSSYRFYDSDGVELAAQNTPANVPTGTSFRLRQLMRQTQSTTLTTESFKLQAGVKASTCSSTTYSDISSIFDSEAVGSSLVDDFAVADTTKWSGGYANGAATVSTGGTLELWLDATHEGFLLSNSVHNMTGASASVELRQKPSAGNGDNVMGLALIDSTNSNNSFKIAQVGNSLEFLEYVDGTVNSGTAIAFSLTTHKFVRIRENAGTIYWETSPDNATWTIQRQKTFGIPSITSMRASIYTDLGPTSTSTTFAVFDNFNLTPGTTATDEGAITARAGDPVSVSGMVVPQTFSANPSFTVRTALQSGENGMWEYALKASPEMDGKTYCFRMAKSDDTLLNSYAQYAEVTVGASTPAGAPLDQQMRGGQAVVNGQKTPFSW